MPSPPFIDLLRDPLVRTLWCAGSAIGSQFYGVAPNWLAIALLGGLGSPSIH